MSPDEIRVLITRDFADVAAVARQDGWAFYLRPPRKGSNPNRIIRVSRTSANAATKIKLAVSARRGAKNAELTFTGDERALRKYVEQELRLFREHFAE